MSYVPLSKPFGTKKTIRNRAWRSAEDGITNQYGYRYLAPCSGVTDDDGVYRHECSTSSDPVVPTDLCGKPFRTGSNFVIETADGIGNPCGGRPK